MSDQGNTSYTAIAEVVLKHTEDAIFSLDQNGTILLCNAATTRIFGIDPEQLMHQPIGTIIPELEKKLSQVRHQNTLNMEFKTHTDENHYLDIKLISFAVENEYRYLAIVHDITTITRTNKALNEQKEQLERQNAIRYWHMEMLDRIRYARNIQELYQQLLDKMVSIVEADRAIVYEYDDQNQLLKVVSGYAFPESRQPGSTITLGEGLAGAAAYKQSPVSLSDHQADAPELETSGTSIPLRHCIAMPVVYDNEILAVFEFGRMQAFSPDADEFLQNPADAFGVNLSMFYKKEQMQTLLEKTQTQAEELQAQQEELKTANEELEENSKTLQEQQQSLEQANEELEQQSATLEEQKNQLEKQNKQLEHTKIQMQQKAEELARANQYKSEFLANVSHELRTPLNSILILSQLFMENHSGNLTDKQIESARTIYQSGSDLLALINDILDLSKIQANQLQPEPEQVNLGELVDKLYNVFQPQTEQKGLNLQCCCDSDVPQHIYSDPMRLEQILKNLLSNALKFTEQGTVALQIRAPANTANIPQAWREVTGGLVCEVSDTGGGIPDDKFNDIFESFKQVDGSIARKHGGTGLGLAIAKKLSGMLGGDIHVSSIENQGSNFALIIATDINQPLPFAKQGDQETLTESLNDIYDEIDSETTQAGEADDDRHHLGPERKTILAIEADKAFGEWLKNLMHDDGFQFLWATQGRQGLAMARKYAPAGILLDSTLPDTDGPGVLKKLKDDPSTRAIPVQVLSAEDKAEDILSSGAINVIRKPASAQTIHQAIQERVSDSASQSCHLLVVDQDNALKKTLATLENALPNAVIHPESSVDAALQYLDETPVNGVIIEIDLQAEDGMTVVRHINDNQELRHIPVIIYTRKELGNQEYKDLATLSNAIILKTDASQQRLLMESRHLFDNQGSQSANQENENTAPSAEASEQHRGRILIADDDTHNIYALSQALSGYVDIITAEDGRQAVDTYQQNPDIDLILMDMMMPEMSGYDATRAIRRFDSTVPIIALTAKAMKGDRQQCFDAGCNDYHSKPVDPNEIASLIQVWLKR